MVSLPALVVVAFPQSKKRNQDPHVGFFFPFAILVDSFNSDVIILINNMREDACVPTN
jgi:hypothetical protein